MRILENRIVLDGDEFATAIDAYLTAHNVHVSGPRAVSTVVDGESRIARDVTVSIYVDPSGRIVDNR
jgi:hypothetical protein